MANKQQQPHFLLVTFAAQGHINPCRLLARRLARHAGARVTISTSTSAHCRMFPHTSEQEPTESAVEEGGLVTYRPYSDGTNEEGLDAETQFPLIRQRIVQSLTGIASDLAARGQPVTCVIYALIMTMAIDVARELSVPCILLWIQPASVFSIYYHYFNRGYDKIIGASSAESSAVLELPGLPLLQMEDLPSFLVHRPSDGSADPYSRIYNLFQEVFQTVEKEMSRGSSKRPKVLLNTFDELEAGALSSIGDVEMIAVGPLVPPALLGHLDSESASTSSIAITPGDLFDHDSKAYIEWLDSKEEKSVAYVSFGSLAMLSRRQMEEISRGLDECGRPYIWVVRKDLLKKEDSDQGGGEIIACNVSGEGMVVEWCNQASVLSHRSVGCFVTHCGWNSTLESMVCGVPMVLLPQWTDQATNARLVEGEWGMGVRAKVSGEGIVESSELRKCLDAVMGDGDGGERGSDMRRSAETWKCKAKAALGEGGSSVQNIVKFVEGVM